MLRRISLCLFLIFLQASALAAPEGSFSQAAARIRSIEDGRVSAVFWDLASATEADFQMLGAAGFNEVIVEGRLVVEGTIPKERVMRQILAASRAGITSFKFVLGTPEWATAQQVSARRKVTALAARIVELKEGLRQRGETRAAGSLKGMVVNVEPYTQRNWGYDLSGYVQLHNELQAIAAGKGLTYETFDAFWIGQPMHESGNRMTGYQVSPYRTSYVMSYRRSGYDTFKVSEFFATRVPHIVGFDLVSGGYVGFRENPTELPQAVSDVVKRTFSVPNRSGFRGIFVNASRAGDITTLIRRSTASKEEYAELH